jgi:hypothetical protein
MSLEAALQTANASIRDLVEKLGSDERIDVASIPAGALSWAIAKAADAHPERRFVIVTADVDEAYRHESNLRFLLAGGNTDVLLFAAADTSPLLDVVPDRRAEMQRMAEVGTAVDRDRRANRARGVGPAPVGARVSPRAVGRGPGNVFRAWLADRCLRPRRCAAMSNRAR